MHVLLYLTSFTALVAARPRPQDDPEDDPSIPISITEELPTATVPVIESTSLNIPITSLPSIIPTGIPGLNFTTSTSKRAGHWEPIPVYSCNCVTLSKPSYPCWAYDDYHVSLDSSSWCTRKVGDEMDNEIELKWKKEMRQKN